MTNDGRHGVDGRRRRVIEVVESSIFWHFCICIDHKNRGIYVCLALAHQRLRALCL